MERQRKGSDQRTGGNSNLLAEGLRESHPIGQVSAAGFDNFQRVFAINSDDRVLLLIDRDLDPRVVQFMWDFARGRGASVEAVMLDGAGIEASPDHVLPMIEQATFVVATWYAAVGDARIRQMRREKGQRWVKITHFRTLELLNSEAAAFPIDVISLLLRKTAEYFTPGEPAAIHTTDPRGTDLEVELTAELVDKMLGQARWRGELEASRPGCYVHYISTHGPNLYSGSAAGSGYKGVNGKLVPQWSVGFAEPWDERIEIDITDNIVKDVSGMSDTAIALREMVSGGSLIELGSGFNPKHPRNQLYPAGSNSPGAIHFGFDLLHESTHVRQTMPDWAEPPVHADLVDLDATLTVNGELLIKDGFLLPLRDPEVRELAARYDDPPYLLEEWPTV